MTQEKVQIDNIIRLLTSKNTEDIENGYIIGKSVFGFSKEELDMIVYNRTGISNLDFTCHCTSLEVPSSVAPITNYNPFSFVTLSVRFDMDILENKDHWIIKLLNIDKMIT